MTRTIGGIAFAVALAGCAAMAVADDAVPPGIDDKPADRGPPWNKSGLDMTGQRFHFTKVSDGVLRLDSDTGQVSLCSARTVGWACQAVPDDRAALDGEIARLQAQVESLNKEVADLRGSALLPPRPPETVPPSKQGELKLPNRDDLNRAKALIDDAWRRLVDMLEQWRKEKT
ncbi:MAG: hypothetical protein ACR2K5_01570 [Pseudolabrys sp.]